MCEVRAESARRPRPRSCVTARAGGRHEELLQVLATKQSQVKDVKSLAHHMMVDHTKLTMELKKAAPRGATVPKDNSDTTVLDPLKGLRRPAHPPISDVSCSALDSDLAT